MSNKTKLIYDHVIQFINNNFFEFNAVSFITDYEKALRNSLKKHFPLARLKGCWFHYCNALRRNASPMNIRKLKTNKEALRIYKKLMILPLLAPQHIAEAYTLLKNDCRKIKNYPEFKNFFHTLKNNAWRG